MGDAGAGGGRRAPPPSARAAAVEKTYWLDDRGFYAFATALAQPEKALRRGARARGAPRARRASRRCADGRSSTRTRCCPRCRCGGARSTPSARSRRSTTWASAALATDWGAAPPLRPQRALRSAVVPLRLGVGALHRLGRRWARTATAARTSATRRSWPTRCSPFQYALGYVTELLSGRLQRAVRPLVAPPGLVGGDGGDAARARACSASRPADGGRRAALRARSSPRTGTASAVRNVAVGRRARSTSRWSAAPDALTMHGRARRGGRDAARCVLAPALPLDARVRVGDRRRPRRRARSRRRWATCSALEVGCRRTPGAHDAVVFALRGGHGSVRAASTAAAAAPSARACASLRARPEADALRLVARRARRPRATRWACARRATRRARRRRHRDAGAGGARGSRSRSTASRRRVRPPRRSPCRRYGSYGGRAALADRGTTRRPSTSRSTSTCPLGQRTSIASARARARRGRSAAAGRRASSSSTG